MNDEEFKKKLESILGNLYRIDQEVREYLDKGKLIGKDKGYGENSYRNDDPKAAREGKDELFKAYSKKQ